MDNSAYQKIQEALQKSQQIGILVAQNPTLDTMGAGLALFLAGRDMGKGASIASPSEPLVELTSLVGIDQVQSSLSSGSSDLVVSFPYKEGEIEKVSYTVEGGYLNIVVKPSEEGLSFTERDVRYSHGTGEVDLLFVIGAKSLQELGILYNPESMKNATVVNIDVAQNNSGFGDIVLVSPQASSVSELVANFFAGMGYDPDIDTAQNLLEGISYATENFQSPRTSSLAFEMAGILMRKGAVRIADTAPYMPQQPQPQQFAQPYQQMPQPTMPQPMPSYQQPVMPQTQPAFNNQMAQPQQNIPQPMMQQPMPTQAQTNLQQQLETQPEPPADWLTPKVYKGSSNV